MPQPPKFIHTQVDQNVDWSSFHQIIAHRKIPLYLTPGTVAETTFGETTSTIRQHADALNAILAHCEAQQEELCVPGSRWSLSEILDPKNVLLDQGAFNKVTAIPPHMGTADLLHRTKSKQGKAFLAQGGVEIGTLNHVLGRSGYALQTSGASDGHRLAGLLSTGTHGSALNVGALHDTVLGIYLVTGPGTAVFVQPSQRLFTDELSRTLAANTGFKTTEVLDDDVFGAAIVGLGAMGFVHSVILETVPLYEFTGEVLARPMSDPGVIQAINTLDTTGLGHPGRPDFLNVVVCPYADPADLGAIITILHARAPTRPYAAPDAVTISQSTDLTRLISGLVDTIDGTVTGGLVEALVTRLTLDRFKPRVIPPRFPGQMFGPTSLAEGNGRSTEIVVDHRDAMRTVKVLVDALRAEGKQGRHLLGGIGMRFAPATQSLLGMNIAPMVCFLEMPGLNSEDITTVYRACWKALDAAGINYTCHWGQENELTPARIAAYFGDRVERWRKARARVLPKTMSAVFTNTLVKKVGLTDGP